MEIAKNLMESHSLERPHELSRAVAPSAQSRMIRLFTNSAGFLLLASGMAMCISNRANVGFESARDPILGISMTTVFWIIGSVELSVGLFCLFGIQDWLKIALTMWLALNFLSYRIGLVWTVGPGSFNGYWGNLAEAFHITPGTASWILTLLFSYLLIGGSALLAWSRLQKFQVQSKETFFKTACAHCGGHIKFSAQNIGQKIPCPHCHSTITLQTGNLKMCCVLCGGHIEFPAHALGQKIPCPHCRATITLLNQFKIA
jgi:DNA-directed RNA polymerase subunit RPC12/RpoP